MNRLYHRFFREYVSRTTCLQKNINILGESLMCSSFVGKLDVSEECWHFWSIYRKTSLMEASFQYSWSTRDYHYNFIKNVIFLRDFPCEINFSFLFRPFQLQFFSCRPPGCNFAENGVFYSSWWHLVYIRNSKRNHSIPYRLWRSF